MRDYSLLFGLAALGLIVGRRQVPAPQRPAATSPLSPEAVVRGKEKRLSPTNGKVSPPQVPGPASN